MEMKRLQTIASVAAAGALLAVPAAGQAHHKTGHANGGNGGGANGAPGKSCTKKSTVNKGFSVKGTLVTYREDDAATPNVNEESVTVTVTRQNRHARRAGLTDDHGGAAGLQYKLNDADDDFLVQLSGFEAGVRPAAGDRVHIIGKVAVTKRKCAPAGTSLEDRYGAVNVRKVKIVDAD